MTLATNIATVPPSAASTLALEPAPGHGDDVPKLNPLPQNAALVVVETSKPRFWTSWLSKAPPPPVDPNLAEANRAFEQSRAMAGALANLHRILPYDPQLLQAAPHDWEQLFTGYDTARASAIAMLAGLKTRLDTAALSGATAAMSGASRARYEAAASNVISADAECASLRPAVRTRHTAASEAAAEAARLAAEKVVSAKVARTEFDEELRALSGVRRASLEERLGKLWGISYRFGPPFSEEQAKNPGSMNLGVPALEVIPLLADKQGLCFGKADGYNRISMSASEPIRSIAELEDLVARYMGKGEQNTEG